MTTDWLNHVKALINAKQDFVIISVVNTRGSTPSNVGERVICVNRNIIYGTIGGGKLEYQAINHAATLSYTIEIHTYFLTPKFGQCCGGAITLMFEKCSGVNCLKWLKEALALIENKKDFVIATVVNSTSKDYVVGNKYLYSQNNQANDIGKYADFIFKNKQNTKHIKQIELTNGILDVYYEAFIESNLLPVVIFGAGHITYALIPIIINLPIKLYLIDDRKNELEKYNRYDKMTIINSDSINKQIPDNSYFLIMSYSHRLDFDMCLNILKTKKFNYLGLIGSNAKASRFRMKLKRMQIDEKLLTRLVSPIGKKYKVVQSPNAIAISIATGILEFLEGNS